VQRTAALDDLEALLSNPDFSGIRKDVQDQLREMVDTYLYYKNQKDIYDRIGGNDQLIDAIKVSTREKVKELATYNENTQAAYNGIFRSLLDD